MNPGETMKKRKKSKKKRDDSRTVTILTPDEEEMNRNAAKRLLCAHVWVKKDEKWSCSKCGFSCG